jgi:hypothetical protein
MLPAWNDLIQYIRTNYPSDEDLKFMYGKNYGWAWRFRIRGKLLTSVYPTHEGFTVQINLSPHTVEKAQHMELGNNVQGAIARVFPHPEGCWVFVPVGLADDIGDIHKLLALRVESKREHPSKCLPGK